ncbi:MAG: N-acetylmuramoyl-L-alanine amidase, partial [Phycisphaerae bacterium]|nr:N-acetylmuramoyl-L-alanine amidase [Phycisphaerae bacterium]
LQHRGATVINTRKDDRFLELDARAAYATRNRADLFVSIHADSAPRKTASGATVYTCRGASANSVAAAWYIRRALTQAGIPCRTGKPSNFRVLVAHPRPAVLVECGFLTNAGDAALLNTQAHRSKVAAAIARGIADYLCR